MKSKETSPENLQARANMGLNNYLSKIAKLSIITKVALGVVLFVTTVLIVAAVVSLQSQRSIVGGILDKNRLDVDAFIARKKDENLQTLRKNMQFNAKIIANTSSSMLYNVDNVALDISLRPFMDIQEIAGIMIFDGLSTIPFIVVWKNGDRIESAFGSQPKEISFPLNLDSIEEDIVYGGEFIGEAHIFYSSGEILKRTEEQKRLLIDELETFESEIQSKLDSSMLSQGVIVAILIVLLVVVLLFSFNKLEQKIEERTNELEKKNDVLSETLKQLQSAQQQLVESEKMAALGGLVAGVAHEINTPVGIGITAASYLDEKSSEFMKLYGDGKMKRSDLEKFLDTAVQSSSIILSNLNRAAELIQSFKQVAVDQSSEEKRSFKLKEYIDEILLSLRPKLKKTKHKVIVECSDNIEMCTYPGAFSQVLTNLIMNSLIHAFSQEDEGEIRIIIKENATKERVIIEYADNGRGIPPENIKRVFEPFFTTKRGQGGSGLGLHIIYNIVTQKMGGTVVCESEVGQGVKFTIDVQKDL